MKKYVVLAGIFMLLAVGVTFAESTAPNVNVDVLKYDPAPAEPGKFLDMWLNIESAGSPISDYVLELVPGYPFFPDTGENSVRNFAYIDTDGVRTKYKLRVAEDAPSGDAILKVKHYKKGSEASVTKELTIEILGKVDVDLISAQPDTLIPGKPTRVAFLFNNSGRAPVKDLVITWSDPNKQILPLAGENRYRIEELPIGESKIVEFSMVADPGITQGVHLINLNMSFQRFGLSDSRSSQLAFMVGGITSFDVSQQEAEGSTISISVANIGVNIATGVLVNIPEQEGWKILGGSSVFLGNLNPGDFTVASVQAEPISKDIIQNMKVNVEYTDTTGTRQTDTRSIRINFATPVVQKSGGIDGTTIVIVIIVLGAAVWYIRKKRKEKAKHK